MTCQKVLSFFAKMFHFTFSQVFCLAARSCGARLSRGSRKPEKRDFEMKTAHNPTCAVKSKRVRRRVPMKALSERVRILKNSKIKIRAGSKRRATMSSDASKDKNEEFLSGVVEGKGFALRLN